MTIKIHNTLSNKKEVFKPRNNKKVEFFCCGPTVYSDSHIGHAKTYVQFDIIVKYLRYLGYKVFYLQNITDVDDKIINRAKELNISTEKLAKEQIKEYFNDVKALRINSVNKYANATSYIKQIESQILKLIKRDYAYKMNDGIYFDIGKFKDYGKLSGRTVEEAEDAISRIDKNVNKKNKGDFCLWKFSKAKPSWKSKVGIGRPGWHIEDTAITETIFGNQYDMHGGAIDLIFPHHEAEIAQMESISGKKPLVKYWLHTGFLKVDGKKMAKSLGNFITIKDAIKKYDVNSLRFLFVSTHYRSPIDFSEKNMIQAKNALTRLQDFFEKVKTGKDNKKSLALVKRYKEVFIKNMNDDFNTPKAIASIFDLVKAINKVGGGTAVYKFLLEINKIFDILELKKKKLKKDILNLIIEREKARAKKDWKKADKIRADLKKEGIILEDTKKGVSYKIVK